MAIRSTRIQVIFRTRRMCDLTRNDHRVTIRAVSLHRNVFAYVRLVHTSTVDIVFVMLTRGPKEAPVMVFIRRIREVEVTPYQIIHSP